MFLVLKLIEAILMKKIEAIIKPFKLDEVKESLFKILEFKDFQLQK